jgi:hypothetical protein
MTRYQRLLESENHTKEHLGDCPPHQRSDIEDKFIQSLEDTHCEGRLDSVRTFLSRHSRDMGLTEQMYLLCMHNDGECWSFVHFWTCNLRRMMPRWERSANVLWQAGITELPQGVEYLGF